MFSRGLTQRSWRNAAQLARRCLPPRLRTHRIRRIRAAPPKKNPRLIPRPWSGFGSYALIGFPLNYLLDPCINMHTLETMYIFKSQVWTLTKVKRIHLGARPVQGAAPAGPGADRAQASTINFYCGWKNEIHFAPL